MLTGIGVGCHTAANRAARRSAASLAPPIQIGGCGCCSGLGLTCDRMSGGRLITGIGVGWNEAEFTALGVPFHERGARSNEYLRLWQACWAPGKVSFEGKFVSFADMRH